MLPRPSVPLLPPFSTPKFKQIYTVHFIFAIANPSYLISTPYSIPLIILRKDAGLSPSLKNNPAYHVFHQASLNNGSNSFSIFSLYSNFDIMFSKAITGTLFSSTIFFSLPSAIFLLVNIASQRLIVVLLIFAATSTSTIAWIPWLLQRILHIGFNKRAGSHSGAAHCKNFDRFPFY